MQAAESLARTLAARTVHVRMTPTAKTFSERREVLRVLERFGKVEFFKGLKYNMAAPSLNAFIAVFEDESSATELFRLRQIRYKLISQIESAYSSRPHPHNQPEATIEISDSLGEEEGRGEGESAMHNSESNTDIDAEESSASPPNTEEKIFQLTLAPSSYPHHTFISSPLHNPLHGPYTPISPRRSFIASALSSSVPPSIYAAGLRDWETDGVKRRVANDGVGGGSTGGGGGWGSTNVPWRIANKARKRLEEEVPDVMRGLKGLQGLKRSIKRYDDSTTSP
ncbi:hypothetical protein F5884DRAFT_857635 [Xylogone sp. PMI_703]|nr:hypothetical protein F5884DRAFT_857635 [Xylogone sp. PMI_703]